MVRIPSSGYIKMHGAGVAGCSSWPNIGFAFNITFTRNTTDRTKVDFQMSDLSMDPNGSHTGSFGYNFITAIGFNDAPDAPDNDDKIWWISEKSASISSNWWNHMGLNNRSGSFTCTSSTTVVKLYVRAYHDGYDCCYNANASRYCYNNGHRFYKVYTSDPISVPAYEEHYTITYNANGGINPPANQQKSNLSDLTLWTRAEISMVYPVTINYYNEGTSTPSDTIVTSKYLNNWTGNDNRTYNPGATYTHNYGNTLTANWGPATFTPIAMPDKNVIVTFNPNGGDVNPQTTAIARQKSGYGTSSSATTPSYYPGTAGTTTLTTLNLYPIYGDATLAVADMPIPTRPGYRFIGWFTDSQTTQKIVTQLSTSVDITIYAGWAELPVHKFNFDGTWKGNSLYVWQMIELQGEKQWARLAPINQFNGSAWTADTIDAYPIFNYGNVVGLDPEFADGIEVAAEQVGYDWQVTDSKIFKHVTSSGDARITLGKVIGTGIYRYLCLDVECSYGTHGQWNRSDIGIRYASQGKGGTDYNNVANKSIALTFCHPTQNDYGFNYIDTTYRDNDVLPYWYELPRQIIKVPLPALATEPFYITMHCCDTWVDIYSMWLE